MTSQGRWSDLAARVTSAAVLILVGLGAVWLGGHVFHLFIALACAGMVWELVRVLDPAAGGRALLLGGLCGVALLAAVYTPPILNVPLLLVPALAGAVLLENRRLIFALFAAAVALAGFGMVDLRDQFGLTWILWLMLVVIASDVLGYFAGKSLGGPKFWPRISPKKTWSGTVAGWIGAALVGLVFAGLQDVGPSLVVFSVIVGFAGQMGDIAESAVKRMAGVKDSSALIPGHGGLLDRFDGMLGASLFLLLFKGLVGLPPGGP